ncbi:hypothetical protein PanWU01x14_001890 [Parasponia andersonii]|uniref:Uncharacterized protein n=1 Tax=Parasponia andersonii TaxID=3476 RepID=A0A2P5E518_PARAD|nr:hypothetical protein PanWU01x14_001890 [Parasponia andersonii]
MASFSQNRSYFFAITILYIFLSLLALLTASSAAARSARNKLQPPPLPIHQKASKTTPPPPEFHAVAARQPRGVVKRSGPLNSGPSHRGNESPT